MILAAAPARSILREIVDTSKHRACRLVSSAICRGAAAIESMEIIITVTCGSSAYTYRAACRAAWADGFHFIDNAIPPLLMGCEQRMLCN